MPCNCNGLREINLFVFVLFVFDATFTYDYLFYHPHRNRGHVMCIHMKHHHCLFIYLFIYSKTFLVNVLIKKASSSLEPKTGMNEQLVMLKGLYRLPEQCK